MDCASGSTRLEEWPSDVDMAEDLRNRNALLERAAVEAVGLLSCRMQTSAHGRQVQKGDTVPVRWHEKKIMRCTRGYEVVQRNSSPSTSPASGTKWFSPSECNSSPSGTRRVGGDKCVRP